MAFFGLSVKGNTSEEIDVPEGAILTITNIALEGKDNEAATVFVQVEMEEDDDKPVMKSYMLCKLVGGKHDSERVEVKLFASEKSKLSVKGGGEVHLTGYLEPDHTFDGIGESDDEEMDEEAMEKYLASRENGEAEDDDDEDEMEEAPKPKKAAPQAPPKKAEQPKKEPQVKHEKPAQEKKRPAEQHQQGNKKAKTEGSSELMCTPCNRPFKNAEALQNHNTAKHNK